MLIINEEEKSLHFSKIEGLGYDTVETLVCEDPYCDCGKGHLLVSDKDSTAAKTPENAALMAINFNEGVIFYDDETIISEEAAAKTKKTITFLQENLTADDWTIISGLSRFQKMMSIEILPHDEQYQYTFSEEQQKEVALKIAFEEIFPACERFNFIDEKENLYQAVDVHCKKPNCKCNNIHFLMYKNSEYVEELEYDYLNEQILDGRDSLAILPKLKQKYPQLKMRLAKRTELIRKLAKEKLPKANNSGGVQRMPKVSRNAPCPCGSGKKYKHCCLKK